MENFSPNTHDISQVGVQFGPDFDLEGRTSLKIQVSFSADEIKKQTDLLKPISKSPNDILYSLILEFPTDSPETQSALAQALEGYAKNQKWTGRVEKDQKNGVFLLLRLNPEKEEQTLQPFKFLLAQGLNSICKESQSQLEATVTSGNDFKDLMPYLKDNESLICTLLQSLRVELKLALAKTLTDRLMKVFDKIDPEFNNSPPMMILKYFRNIDVDLRFQSTKELPQNVRNVLFYPEFIRGVSEEDRKMKVTDPNTQVILDKVGSRVRGSIIIPDLGVGRLEVNSPNAAEFMKEYFGLVEIINKKKN